jgi:hypothetical protein
MILDLIERHSDAILVQKASSRGGWMLEASLW